MHHACSWRMAHLKPAVDALMLTLAPVAPADALSISGFACNAAYFAPRIKTAVARALTCAVANVFAGAINAQTPSIAYACSDTLGVTGLGTVCSARLMFPLNAAVARCCGVQTPFRLFLGLLPEYEGCMLRCCDAGPYVFHAACSRSLARWTSPASARPRPTT